MNANAPRANELDDFMGLSFVADAAIGEALDEGIVISTPHSCAGYPAIPQIKPDLSERT